MSGEFQVFRKAQVKLHSCQFCNEQGMQWKCVECNVFIYTLCKEKIHQRLKSVLDHEAVNVSDRCEDNSTRRDVASEVITSVLVPTQPLYQAC